MDKTETNRITVKDPETGIDHILRRVRRDVDGVRYRITRCRLRLHDDAPVDPYRGVPTCMRCIAYVANEKTVLITNSLNPRENGLYTVEDDEP